MGADAPSNRATIGRLLALLAVGLLPWTVILLNGQFTLVFSFGLVNTNPLHLTNLYDYLTRFTLGLPRSLQAWPASTLLYLGALVSAATGFLGREDRRLTGGLLVFAGGAQFYLTIGLIASLGNRVFPLGMVALWTVAWWFYGPDLRHIFRHET
ncbi:MULTISPECIES: TIGR04206 family protein [unclassified Haladaptatus]|uniref:TIGR04206 family protein n=1 Tax=unclassified Haladaptatus TaxID=2622732 RepID=UPI0023E8DC8D|nr:MULTISPECIES: TIGR04206 family protein [unclassified Haladaptatus]